MSKPNWNEQSLYTSDTSTSGQWIWTLTGVTLGLFILLLFYLSNSSLVLDETSPNTDPAVSTTGTVLRPLSASTPEGKPAAGGSNSADLLGENVPQMSTSPSKSEPPTAQKPRFTFYQELVDPQPSEHPIPFEKPTEPDPNPSSADNLTSASIDPISAEDEPPKAQLDAQLDAHLQPQPEPSQLNEAGQPIAQNIPEPTVDFITPQAQHPGSEQKSSGVSLTAKRYLLQTGSFKNQLQADRQRAKLLLQGYEADIRAVTLNNGSVWHRVLMGPFDRTKAIQMQTKLESENVESQLRLSTVAPAKH